MSGQGAPVRVELLELYDYAVIKIILQTPVLKHSDLHYILNSVTRVVSRFPRGYTIVISGKLPRWVFMSIAYWLSSMYRVCTADIYSLSAICVDGEVIELPWQAF